MEHYISSSSAYRKLRTNIEYNEKHPHRQPQHLQYSLSQKHQIRLQLQKHIPDIRKTIQLCQK